MRKIVSVKELGEIITGNTPPRNDPDFYGDYKPFIKATDISESSKYTYKPEEYYSEKAYKKYIRSLIPKGSTCVVTIGSVGKKMTVAHCDLFINQAMNAIVPNQNFDSEYVYYVMKNNIHKLKKLDSGTASGRENVSKSAFSNMEIEIDDDITKQKKIGRILSAYDNLIENNQKQIKLLEEAAQRLYKQWFIDLRYPGHETTPIVDGLPEGWRNITLGDVYGKIESGSRPKGGIDSSIRDGIVSVGAENVIGLGQYNYSSEKLVSHEFYENSKRGKVEDRDILVYKDGAYIGRTSLFQDEFPRKVMMVNEHVFLLNAKDPLYQYYLFFTLNRKEFFDKMQKLNKNSAQPGINQDALKSLVIIWPQDEIVMKFDNSVAPMVKKIFALAKQNYELSQSRDRLLPKLMNGELEV